MPKTTPARVGEMYSIIQVAITAEHIDRKNLHWQKDREERTCIVSDVTNSCSHVLTRSRQISQGAVILRSETEKCAHRYVLGDRALHYLRIIGQTVEQLAGLGLVEECRFLGHDGLIEL
jgi:hypothetical protein